MWCRVTGCEFESRALRLTGSKLLNFYPRKEPCRLVQLRKVGLVEVLVLAGELAAVVKGASVVVVTVAPGEEVRFVHDNARPPATSDFDPWYEGHNFGWTPDN